MALMREFWRGFLSRLRGEGRSVRARMRAVEGGGMTDVSEVIKEPPMEIDGRVMTPDEFVRYVEELDFAPSPPTRIFLHHTWRPTPEEWRGFDSLLAMKAYYEQRLWEDNEGFLHEGWTAGPHLFVAEDGIWLFSDLRYDGVGVYGHNYRSRHIEMVGNYDHELPSGAILESTIQAVGALHERLGLDINGLSFHRDFSNKSCPGWAVRKDWIIPQISSWIQEYRRAKEKSLGALRRSLVAMVRDVLVPMNPQAALAQEAVARSLLGALTNEIPMEIDDRGYVVQLFAETLIVPVNEWDKVQSLYEFVEEHKGRARAPRDRAIGPDETGDVTPPPHDPFPFDGNIR